MSSACEFTEVNIIMNVPASSGAGSDGMSWRLTQRTRASAFLNSSLNGLWIVNNHIKRSKNPGESQWK